MHFNFDLVWAFASYSPLLENSTYSSLNTLCCITTTASSAFCSFLVHSSWLVRLGLMDLGPFSKEVAHNPSSHIEAVASLSSASDSRVATIRHPDRIYPSVD